MNNKSIYKIWAPFHKKWVDWVRPVPFINIGENIKQYKPSNISFPGLEDVDLSNTAIIVDLPNTKSVEAGILLAQEYGYRPIPIYNGVIEQHEARATTDNTSISDALVWGAYMLSQIDIKDNANPAFLIYTNRLDEFRPSRSIFDNSWDVYPQDIPSEDYFLKNGITKILVIGNKFPIDLKLIFAEYPQKKIEFFITDGYDKPKKVQIKGKLNPKARIIDD
jgi:hypothetical protein